MLREVPDFVLLPVGLYCVRLNKYIVSVCLCVCLSICPSVTVTSLWKYLLSHTKMTFTWQWVQAGVKYVGSQIVVHVKDDIQCFPMKPSIGELTTLHTALNLVEPLYNCAPL